MLDMLSPGPFACRTPPDVSRPGSWATGKRQLALRAVREPCVHQLPGQSLLPEGGSRPLRPSCCAGALARPCSGSAVSLKGECWVFSPC